MPQVVHAETIAQIRDPGNHGADLIGMSGRALVLSCAFSPMSRLPRTEILIRVALGAVLLLTAVLYLRALGEAPIAVGVDEARVAVHAQALAATGRDNNGGRTPLFFHITNPLIPGEFSDEWWQPI